MMLTKNNDITIRLSDNLPFDDVIERYIEIIKAREQHEINLIFKENRIRLGKPLDFIELNDMIARQHDLMMGLIGINENGDDVDLENMPH